MQDSMTATELGAHLGVSCSKTRARIVARTGLEPVAGRYPWRRVLRCIHGTEGHLLAGRLAELKAAHGTPACPQIADPGARAGAQGAPLIDALDDLEEALKAPLWSFERMSRILGKRPDTLAKALRQGRLALPFPTLQLGPRLRLYRPLEVRLWCEDGIRLALPPAMTVPAPQSPAATAARPAEAPAETARKVVFGGFGRARQPRAG